MSPYPPDDKPSHDNQSKKEFSENCLCRLSYFSGNILFLSTQRNCPSINTKYTFRNLFCKHLCMVSNNSHSLSSLSSSSSTYQRHQPEKTTLYKLIQEHLLSFYQHIDNEQEKGLPDFVKKEFEAFLKCGLLSHRFLRLQCESCRQEKLVASVVKKEDSAPAVELKEWLKALLIYWMKFFPINL